MVERKGMRVFSRGTVLLAVALVSSGCGGGEGGGTQADGGATAEDAADASEGDAPVGGDATGEDVAGLAFPPGFLWGTATAGFQVDMGCPTISKDECADTNSDWYQYATSPITQASAGTHLSGQDPAEVSPGHWELYESDFDLAKAELGTNAFRMSLEWSRIFPGATDEADSTDDLAALADSGAVEHYHAVFAALKARGVTPLVTLHHYTLPAWIHDAVGCHTNLDTCSPRGWLDEERIVREMAKYAGFAAKEFGAEVDLWATQNEPLAVVLPGYLLQTEDRTNPPAVAFRAAEARVVLRAMIYAHAAATDAIRANDAEDADGDGMAHQVGLVYNMTPVIPQDPNNSLDVAAAENTFYLYNLYFLNAVAGGIYDDDGDGQGELREELAGRMDYVGINYYTRVRVQGMEAPVLPDLSPLTTFNPLTLSLWEDYPDGLYEMATYVKQAWDLPVIVTENGVIFEDDEEAQASFLVRHVAALHRAASEGVDVRGYFYWSLMDNFEWNHGTAMRFGLLAVARDATKARTVREAGRVYGEMTKFGGIPEALLTRMGVK